MRRSLFLAVLVTALAAGCMGDGKEGGDGAAEGLRAFLVAASEGDDSALRERIATGSRLDAEHVRERIPRGVEVPSADDFLVLREGDATVSATDLSTPFGAYAAPVRRDGEEWKVEIAPEELRLVEGPPFPRSGMGPDQRVSFAVYSAERDLVASLWIDGAKQMLAGAGGPEFTRYWTTPELDSGSHLAVALAQAGGKRAAVAWTFSVGLPG